MANGEEDDFDWDAEDFNPDAGFVKKDEWKDEDIDLNKEVLEESKVVSKNPPENVPPKKTKQERIEEKKAQRRTEEAKILVNEEVSLTASEQLSEKLRLQKVQEDADLEVTKELFGLSGALASGSGIDEMNPKTQEEFDTFREALRCKLQTLEISTLYVDFLDTLLRDIAVSLDIEGIRRLSSSLTHIANEKQKAIKGTKSKKKGGGSKASLSGGKAVKKLNLDNEDFGDEMGAEFDDFM